MKHLWRICLLLALVACQREAPYVYEEGDIVPGEPVLFTPYMPSSPATKTPEQDAFNALMASYGAISEEYQFEIAMFQVAFGGSLIAKKEVASWPIVGWVAKKFGVVFVDRNPSTAMQALETVQKTMKDIEYPLFVFPEGTTTNGAYVKPFKSTLFSIVEGSNITVQPVVVNYRFRNGNVISPEDMANHYAYFDNKKMDMGPLAERERSAFGQLYHVMMLGGMMIEMTVLPAPDLTGMDRKQIAEKVGLMVSEKYMELKNKKVTR